MLISSPCQAVYSSSGKILAKMCFCKFHRAATPEDLRDTICVERGMQPLKEFFPWAEFYAGPGLLYKDVYGSDGTNDALRIPRRQHFPKVLPEVQDTLSSLDPGAGVLFDAIWYHMAGLDWHERDISSSIEVPAWAGLD